MSVNMVQLAADSPSLEGVATAMASAIGSISAACLCDSVAVHGTAHFGGSALRACALQCPEAELFCVLRPRPVARDSWGNVRADVATPVYLRRDDLALEGVRAVQLAASFAGIVLAVPEDQLALGGVISEPRGRANSSRVGAPRATLYHYVDKLIDGSKSLSKRLSRTHPGQLVSRRSAQRSASRSQYLDAAKQRIRRVNRDRLLLLFRVGLTRESRPRFPRRGHVARAGQR